MPQVEDPARRLGRVRELVLELQQRLDAVDHAVPRPILHLREDRVDAHGGGAEEGGFVHGAVVGAGGVVAAGGGGGNEERREQERRASRAGLRGLAHDLLYGVDDVRVRPAPAEVAAH